ncbi:hypothetical protein GCM10009678_65230 [Actinomadura kijaniata]|uniref:Peptidoglycan/LPS O-acetylase OafA/YrhL n=1 Tax=Actinomadura namibiensis TaxID=182080 RepID=A0A7W3QR41_ACTNM|nr:peptidoglycan/LPS O-acetylase OafA/YrhL [Actinomadura namibiensis]
MLAVTGTSAAPGFVREGVTPPPQAVANLFLVHTWVPARDFVYSANPASWSLGSEAFFYLLFPLVRRIPRSRLPVAAGATVALVVAVPSAALALTGPAVAPGVLDEPMVRFWFACYLPVCRLPEFVLGMVLARMVREGWRPRVGVAAPLAAALAVCLWSAPGCRSRSPTPRSRWSRWR